MNQNRLNAVLATDTATRHVLNNHESEKNSQKSNENRTDLDLRALMGVRSNDAEPSPTRNRIDSGAVTKSRWALNQRSASAVIFILIVVTVASLTLLVVQSHNYSSLEANKPDGQVSTHETTQAPVQSDSGKQAPTTPSSQPSAQAESNNQAGASTSTSTESQTQNNTQDTRIDINTATVEQLDALPGIGPTTAKKIITYRQAHGRFSSVDSLSKIDGIGAKSVEKLRAYVVVR